MRYGVSVRKAESGSAWQDLARRYEDWGFDLLQVPDHVGWFDPFTAIVAAAAVTERLRFGTFVLNIEFWNPLLLARVAATTDLVTDGRLELGLGAGHARVEFEQAGLRYPPARERVARLAAAVPAIRRLLAGETVDDTALGLTGAAVGFAAAQRPVPVLVGGNGDRVLGTAARHADAVGFVGFTAGTGQTHTSLSHWSWDGLAERVAFVRAAASGRAGQLELNVLVQRAAITDDPEAAVADMTAGLELSPDAVLDSPFLMLGTEAQLRAHIDRLASLGIGCITVFSDSAEAVAALPAAPSDTPRGR
jgi:probable F420-dependent oxidoreductase